MDDVTAKKQIVNKIKEATNILITVSNDPSVDALSAALGLSLLLDKLDKHATAVFSGKIPPAITFLEPEKTFEDTTDSLRDFIIALDKEKADHLRVKPEGDVVKIYVTPYRTTITSDDLTFSQGDFNVEMVIALGVDIQEHLDGALDSHGKILHDATVVSISAGEQVSNLGSINWHEDKASSLSEMVATLAEPLKKEKSLLDKQIATAFMTGVVAETDRFSNPRTTPSAMTIAATLMAAGADQQLIASNLNEGDGSDDDDASDTTPPPSSPPDEPKPSDDSGDVLNIAHGVHNEPGETLEEMDKRVKAEEQRQAAEEAQDKLAEETKPEPKAEPATAALDNHEPSFGGTLNATTDQAAEETRNELNSDQNKTLLSHAYIAGTPSAAPSMSGATAVTNDTSYVDPLSQPSTGDDVHSAYAFKPEEHIDVTPPTTLEPTPIGVPATPITPVSTPAPAPLPPSTPTPADLGLPMPPPLPPTPANPAYSTDPSPVAPPPVNPPEILGDILTSETPPAPPPAAPPSNDPGQFKIPGQ